MKVYVASRFLNRNLVKAFCHKVYMLRHSTMGEIEFVQTWPNEDSTNLIIDGAPDILAHKAIAHKDLREIDESDCVIVITEQCESVPGGMHFEAGYAYAQGKRVIVIGPRVNVFYYMGSLEYYPSIADFLASNFEASFGN